MLEPAARLNPIEIAVDVELHQHRRVIRRPAGRLRIDPAEPKLAQVEFVDKDVDDPNRIVLMNPVFQAFRKQRVLPSIRPLNKALHIILRRRCRNHTMRITSAAAFSHSQGHARKERGLLFGTDQRITSGPAARRPHSKAEYMTAPERFADSQIPLAPGANLLWCTRRLLLERYGRLRPSLEGST